MTPGQYSHEHTLPSLSTSNLQKLLTVSDCLILFLALVNTHLMVGVVPHGFFTIPEKRHPGGVFSHPSRNSTATGDSNTRLTTPLPHTTQIRVTGTGNPCTRALYIWKGTIYL